MDDLDVMDVFYFDFTAIFHVDRPACIGHNEHLALVLIKLLQIWGHIGVIDVYGMRLVGI